jgi:drug/metabolite transporter (DMT)-like permease
VTRRFVVPLVLLGALWGASYLFIKVAVGDLAPTTMVCFRLLGAAPFLFAFLCVRAGSVAAAWRELRGAWLASLVLGIANAAVPYVLIGWGEKHVDSGVAAIANSTVPIFVALLAIRFRPSERVLGTRLLGILAGLGGVALLAGVNPHGGWWAVAGTLAVVAASVCYASASLFAQGRLEHASGAALATGMMTVGGVLLLPIGLAQLPEHEPGWNAIGAVVALALAGTVVAQILYMHLIETAGASRAALVNYVYPIFAVAYGAIFLSEPITAEKLGGMALILAGIGLGSGALRLPRRRALAT